MRFSPKPDFSRSLSHLLHPNFFPSLLLQYHGALIFQKAVLQLICQPIYDVLASAQLYAALSSSAGPMSSIMFYAQRTTQQTLGTYQTNRMEREGNKTQLEPVHVVLRHDRRTVEKNRLNPLAASRQYLDISPKKHVLPPLTFFMPLAISRYEHHSSDSLHRTNRWRWGVIGRQQTILINLLHREQKPQKRPGGGTHYSRWLLLIVVHTRRPKLHRSSNIAQSKSEHLLFSNIHRIEIALHNQTQENGWKQKINWTMQK